MRERERAIEFDGGEEWISIKPGIHSIMSGTLFIFQLFPFISHPQYPTSHISLFFSMETSSRRESRVVCVVAGMRADRPYTRASTPFTCVSSVFEVDPSPPPFFYLDIIQLLVGWNF